MRTHLADIGCRRSRFHREALHRQIGSTASRNYRGKGTGADAASAVGGEPGPPDGGLSQRTRRHSLVTNPLLLIRCAGEKKSKGSRPTRDFSARIKVREKRVWRSGPRAQMRGPRMEKGGDAFVRFLFFETLWGARVVWLRSPDFGPPRSFRTQCSLRERVVLRLCASGHRRPPRV